MSNNLADISVFESIQNTANQSMGLAGSLSVFNKPEDVTDIKSAKEICSRAITKAINAAKKVKELQQKYDTIKSDYEKARQTYSDASIASESAFKEFQTTVISIDKERKEEADTVTSIRMKGDTGPYKTFILEYDEITRQKDKVTQLRKELETIAAKIDF